MTTTTATPIGDKFVEHKCKHAWCTTKEDYIDGSPDHDQGITYVIPTADPGNYPEVGVGVVFHEGEQAAPWVVMHLDCNCMNEPVREIDEDTYLTVDDAIELRDLLDVAISHALGVEVEAR